MGQGGGGAGTQDPPQIRPCPVLDSLYWLLPVDNSIDHNLFSQLSRSPKVASTNDAAPKYPQELVARNVYTIPSTLAQRLYQCRLRIPSVDQNTD